MPKKPQAGNRSDRGNGPLNWLSCSFGATSARRSSKQSAYNKHYESTCYHPLLLFNSKGNSVAAQLRQGNVRSADGWEQLLLPEIERQQNLGKEVWFRADAAFAKPDIYEALEERGAKYAIRIPANDCLMRDIEEMLTRSASRPAHKPVVWYKGFLDQASSWKTARRVVAKVEFHAGGTVPSGGLNRDQRATQEREGCPLLHPARQGRAMDQGR